MPRLVHTLLFALLTIHAASAMSLDEDRLYTPYNQLLSRYTNTQGVDYASWHSNPADRALLKEFLATMATVPVGFLPENQAKALYINLYNAAMIDRVLTAYPVESVTKILPDFAVFKEAFIDFDDKTLSLDQIEKEILLKKYPDPRIHFAVNCASVSCPPLASIAYHSKTLEKQLEQATQAFLSSDEGLRIDHNKKTWHTSSLFNWYQADFAPAGGMRAFIKQYRPDPLPATDPIWIDYNWQLNAQP